MINQIHFGTYPYYPYYPYIKNMPSFVRQAYSCPESFLSNYWMCIHGAACIGRKSSPFESYVGDLLNDFHVVCAEYCAKRNKYTTNESRENKQQMLFALGKVRNIICEIDRKYRFKKAIKVIGANYAEIAQAINKSVTAAEEGSDYASPFYENPAMAYFAAGKEKIAETKAKIIESKKRFKSARAAISGTISDVVKTVAADMARNGTSYYDAYRNAGINKVKQTKQKISESKCKFRNTVSIISEKYSKFVETINNIVVTMGVFHTTAYHFCSSLAIRDAREKAEEKRKADLYLAKEAQLQAKTDAAKEMKRKINAGISSSQFVHGVAAYVSVIEQTMKSSPDVESKTIEDIFEEPVRDSGLLSIREIANEMSQLNTILCTKLESMPAVDDDEASKILKMPFKCEDPST